MIPVTNGFTPTNSGFTPRSNGFTRGGGKITFMPGGNSDVRPGGSNGDNPNGETPVGSPRNDRGISGEMLALTAACCNSMNCRVGDKFALLIPERAKLLVPIPGGRTVPGGS